MNALPAHDDPVLLANDYGEFFVQTLNLLRIPSMTDIEVSPFRANVADPTAKLHSFRLYQLMTIVNLPLLIASSNTSYSQDPILSMLVFTWRH